MLNTLSSSGSLARALHFNFILSIHRSFLGPKIPGTMGDYVPRVKKSYSAPGGKHYRFTGNPLKNEFGKKYFGMPIEEKRKLYRCGDSYVTLSDVIPWALHYKILQSRGKTIKDRPIYKHDERLVDKVAIWQGDITKLEIDAIVNAANTALLGGGGVDGCIHRAAGSSLLDECRTLRGCETGSAKITGGHRLPAKYVIHTVGPMGEQPIALRSCYLNALNLVKKHGIRTVAFPCISTGIYGYPSQAAALVALDAVRVWLDMGNVAKVDLIIFAVFMEKDLEHYQSAMQLYFPLEEFSSQDKSDEESISGVVSENSLDKTETIVNTEDDKLDLSSKDASSEVFESRQESWKVCDLKESMEICTSKQESMEISASKQESMEISASKQESMEISASKQESMEISAFKQESMEISASKQESSEIFDGKQEASKVRASIED